MENERLHIHHNRIDRASARLFSIAENPVGGDIKSSKYSMV